MKKKNSQILFSPKQKIWIWGDSSTRKVIKKNDIYIFFFYHLYPLLSTGNLNPYAIENIKAAHQAGFVHVDAYLFPNINIDPVKQAQDTVKIIFFWFFF